MSYPIKRATVTLEIFYRDRDEGFEFDQYIDLPQDSWDEWAEVVETYATLSIDPYHVEGTHDQNTHNGWPDLQGSYGRTARALIEQGYLTPEGDIAA